MSLQPRKNFGWIPQLPDHRDKLLKTMIPAVPVYEGPPLLDLSMEHKFHVMDQGNLGTCVLHATASALEFTHASVTKKTLRRELDFPVSRLFLYYEARKAIDTLGEDSGCNIRDAMRVLYNVGGPRESGWKYDESMFTVKPPAGAYRSAPYHKITSYQSVGVNLAEMRTALINKMPIVIGVSVFDSWPMGLGQPVVPMPGNYESMIGGHAVLVVGYDDVQRRFKFLNSWGEEWGMGGFGFIPYDYAADPRFGDDYWVLTDTEYKENMTPST